MAKAYDAFISYSHAADARLATALERGLERLARPWNRVRAMSVFRDETDLTLNPDLWAMISDRLDRSGHLVMLMCPESAESPWVNKEVAHWCDAHGVERLLMVWTDGALEWDDTAGDFTAGSSAVATAIRGRFAREPLYLDLRWARDDPDLTLASPRFRTAVARVAAPIRNMAPGDIEGEDLRLRRRAKRLARAAVAVIVALAIVATVAGVLAVRSSRAAEARAREAIARQVGLAALDLSGTDIDRALLMSLVSADLAADDDGRFQSTQVLIGKYSRLEALRHLGDEFVNVRDLALGDDGSIVVVAGRADGSNALATWRPDASVADVEPLPAGAVAEVGPGLASLRGSLLAADTDAGLAWVVNETGLLAMVRLVDGTRLTELETTGDVLADVRGDRGAALADARLTLYDASGIVLASATDAPPATAIGLAADDGEVVVSASVDGAIVRWSRDGDLLTPSVVAAVPQTVGGVGRIALARDGERALLLGSNGTALVDLTSGDAVESPGGGTTVVESDPSGRYVATGGSRLAVWDLDRGDRIIAVPQVAAALDWSGPCDQQPCRLVAGGVAIDVFDPATETQIRLVDEIGVQSVAISPDGGRVVSGGWGESLAVWSVRPSFDDSDRRVIAAQELAAVPAIEGVAAVSNPVCQGAMAVSPNGIYVVALAEGAVARVCTTDDGGSQIAVAQLNPGAGDITAVAVDDDGSVALGRSSGIVEVYPVTDGAFGRGRAIDVRVGGEQVHVPALALRGGLVVAGVTFPGAGQTPARVVNWQLARMEPTSFPIDQYDVARVAVLDPSASVIVVAGRDEPDGPVTVQLWETASRRRVGRALSGLSGHVSALVGLETAVLGADTAGHMFRWEIERDPTRDVCAMAGRPLTVGEWDSFAGGALARYEFEDPCE
jgi:hypothetical protein